MSSHLTEGDRFRQDLISARAPEILSATETEEPAWLSYVLNDFDCKTTFISHEDDKNTPPLW